MKACPFCGGVDISFKVRHPSYGTCEGCGTEGPSADYPTKAIAAWNRRTDPVREALETALGGLMTELEMSAQRPSMIAQNRARSALSLLRR